MVELESGTRFLPSRVPPIFQTVIIGFPCLIRTKEPFKAFVRSIEAYMLPLETDGDACTCR